MKSVDLFCASQASTAICSSTDHRRMVVRHGGDQTPSHHRRERPKNPTIIPCSSQTPISPKYRKSTSSASPRLSLEFLRRKSSADVADLRRRPPPPLSDTPLLLEFISDDDRRSSSSKNMNNNNNNNSENNVVSSKKHDDYPVFRSSSMSNYSYHNHLAIESKVDDLLQHHVQKSSSLSRLNHQNHAQKSPRASSARSPALVTLAEKGGQPRQQVVELRVSIHCRGCEGKIRKHISRMEGVTSFSTDLVTKKVTVVGNVTPLDVLASVSKVKKAELWSAPATPASSSTSSSSSSSTSTRTSGLSITSN